MSKAKVTLLGLYHFHDGLFDQLVLPDGVEKELLINIILDEAADFEVIYADPFFTENMIGLISRKWARTFQKWYDALQLEYDPIENYNRYEHWRDKGTTDNDDTATSADTSNANGQTDTYVNTYDSDSLHQDGRSVSTQSATANSTDTSKRAESRDDTHDGRIHGNIGVTTSQQMLLEELNIDGWNLYEHIANVFIQELCIMVY